MNIPLPIPPLLDNYWTGHAKTLAPWADEAPATHFPGAKAADYASMMQEVDFLLEKGFPLGLALVMGEMDIPVCREIRNVAARQADS